LKRSVKRMKEIDGIKFGYLCKIFLEYREHMNIDHNSRKLKVSYSWLHQTLKALERVGLVILEKRGRQNMISFTPEGKEARIMVATLNKLFIVYKEG